MTNTLKRFPEGLCLAVILQLSASFCRFSIRSEEPLCCCVVEVDEVLVIDFYFWITSTTVKNVFQKSIRIPIGASGGPTYCSCRLLLVYIYLPCIVIMLELGHVYIGMSVPHLCM